MRKEYYKKVFVTQMEKPNNNEWMWDAESGLGGKKNNEKYQFAVR